MRPIAQQLCGGLLYRALSCNAGAMGEFGAVAVVSGKICGQTTTIPLHVEILYNEYNGIAAGLLTLVLKSILEWYFGAELAATGRH